MGKQIAVGKTNHYFLNSVKKKPPGFNSEYLPFLLLKVKRITITTKSY